MKDKNYFSKHLRSNEYGEYVAISSIEFKIICRQYREYETYCIELGKENEKLKAILIKAAETTHKCKELHDWYCENKEKE